MGVHEINIHDIIDLISKESEFLNDLQKPYKKKHFANTIFNNLEILIIQRIE